MKLLIFLGPGSNEISCYTNNTRNIRQIGGALAITAIRENYLKRQFTSAQIEKNNFLNYGKIDIRAAMPEGELLWTEFVLFPLNGRKILHSIRICFYQQLKSYDYALFYNDGLNLTDTKYTYTTDNDLNQFNEYSVEWNETTVIWSFNSKQLLIRKIEIFLPELERMSLFMKLGVGGRGLFDTRYISVKDISWNSSTLLIDYVRYYKWKKESLDEKRVIKNENPSGDSIRKDLKSLSGVSTTDSKNSPKNSSREIIILNSKSSHSSIVITVISVFLIIILILFLYYFFKYKNLRQTVKNESINSDVIYDEFQVNYYSTPQVQEDYYYASTILTSDDYLKIN